MENIDETICEDPKVNMENEYKYINEVHKHLYEHLDTVIDKEDEIQKQFSRQYILMDIDLLKSALDRLKSLV
jgi:hypothetical protein